MPLRTDQSPNNHFFSINSDRKNPSVVASTLLCCICCMHALCSPYVGSCVLLLGPQGSAINMRMCLYSGTAGPTSNQRIECKTTRSHRFPHDTFFFLLQMSPFGTNHGHGFGTTVFGLRERFRRALETANIIALIRFPESIRIFFVHMSSFALLTDTVFVWHFFGFHKLS